MKKIYTTIIIALLSINVFGQVSNWVWAKSGGGNLQDSGESVATDALGNVYVVGRYYSHTITLGSFTLTSAGNTNIYLAKYDVSGTILWAKTAGGNLAADAKSVTTDNAGNVYVTGNFVSSSISFDTITLANSAVGNQNMFIVKYDSMGNALWAKTNGSVSSADGNSVKTDASGNVFITGTFTSASVFFGTDTLTNTNTDYDIYILKLASNGAVLWARSAGGSSYDYAFGVTTDASGNAYITGYFASPTIVFGSTTFTNSSGWDMYIVKYDSAGTILWAKSAGGTSYDQALSVATDTSGNVYVTGSFQSSTIVFDSYTLTNIDITGGSGDIFIVKYSSLGNVVWAKSAGGNNIDSGNSIFADASGIYLTGFFAGNNIAFDSDTLNPAVVGFDNLFVVKLDFSGNVLWAKSNGGNGSIDGMSISNYGSGAVYITGQFEINTIVFGSTSLLTHGDYDMFITKLNSTTGIEVLQDVQSSITISPNPFTSTTTITFSEEQKNTTIKITDVLGREILKQVQNDKSATLDMSGFAKGIYFVRIIDEKKNVTNKKIIKQ